MAGTHVRMVRTITTNPDPNKRYSITSTCLIRGTLTDTGIFLLAINNPNDPKDDTFTRLITIEDVNNFLNDRNDAVLAGATFWRSATSTLYFADIETANAAWKELSSRITALVNAVDAYNTEFTTPETGSVIIYPALDEGAKNSLIAAYEATAQPLADATAARDAKIITCDSLKTEITTVEERLVEAEADLAAYNLLYTQTTLVNGNLPSIYATLLSNNTTVRNANGVSDALQGQKDAIEAILLSNDSQLALFNAELTSVSNINTAVAGIVSTLQTRVANLRSELTSLQSQYSLCTVEGTSLQAAVNQALQNREAALAAVRAVCPDYLP